MRHGCTTGWAAEKECIVEKMLGLINEAVKKGTKVRSSKGKVFVYPGITVVLNERSRGVIHGE